MQKLKMHTPDLTQDNIARIRELFPSCVTEAKDAQGNIKLAVDFDQLKQELSNQIVEGPQERYHLNWPGKREALLTANAPIAKTLRPARDESVDFDTTKNLFIEGDNLEALKLLQETYLGKVKMIYIDPPYNTGGDFIYKDDFSENAEEFKARTNQKDDEGNRLIANPETNGRFHSDWLTFIYPRLKLSRNLLSEDGVILISINDKEQGNLKKICDEIFGEESFVAQFVWNNEGNVDQQSKVKGVHEYILSYCKNIQSFKRPTVIDPNIEEDSKLFNQTIENSITKNGPANPPSIITLPKGFPATFEEGEILPREDAYPHILDKIIVKDSKLISPARVYSGWSSKNLLELYINNGGSPIFDSEGKETWFSLTGTGAIYNYKKRSDDQGHVLSVIRNVGTTKQNSNMLASWGVYFSYPKPVFLIQYLAEIFTAQDKNALILDFFAGSSTTAHAVFRLNAKDGGNRSFIMSQLAEKCAEDSKAFKAGFKNIADMSKERIRKSAENVLETTCDHNWKKDVGFRVLKIDSSNMTDIHYVPDAVKQTDLLKAVENIKPDRNNPEDLLFQVLLDWGVDLTLPIRKEKIQGKQVFFVDDNALTACFDTGITEDLVKELASRKPLRVVFRDNGFTSDAVKINVDQIFKQLSPGTDVKSI